MRASKQYLAAMQEHWSGITAIYGDPAYWRSVTLRASKQYLTAMREHWSGITASYRDLGITGVP